MDELEVGVKEAKDKLPALIKAALRGSRVVIAVRGVRSVALTPVSPTPKDPRRGFGSFKELLRDLPADWEEDPTELFEGLE